MLNKQIKIGIKRKLVAEALPHHRITILLLLHAWMRVSLITHLSVGKSFGVFDSGQIRVAYAWMGARKCSLEKVCSLYGQRARKGYR